MNGTLVEKVVEQGDIPAALFEFLGHFPLFGFIAPFTLIVITIFFITSIDSAALVMDSIANGHEDESPRRQSVFWAVSIGVVCATILVTTGDNGLEILQSVIIVIGFPVFLIGYMEMYMLLRALREDAGELPPLRTRQWKQVIPMEEYRRRAREDFSQISDVVVRPENTKKALNPNTSPWYLRPGRSRRSKSRTAKKKAPLKKSQRAQNPCRFSA